MGINEAEYIFRRQTRYHHCCVACPCGISEQQLIGRSFHRNHREAHCCQDLSYLRLGWDGPTLCAGSPTEESIQKINLQYKCQKGWVSFMFWFKKMTLNIDRFTKDDFSSFIKFTSGIELRTSLQTRHRNVVFVCLQSQNRFFNS